MKKIDYTKLLVVALLITCLGLLYPALSNAGTITDNFDGTAINTHLWAPFQQSQHQRMFQQGGELRIQLDAGSDDGAGVNSKFRLKGDFDATVDYRLISWPPTNGVRLGFEGGTNDLGYMVKRISCRPDDPPIQKEIYFAYFLDGSHGGQVPTTDTQGSLRLTRVGEVLTGYFKQNGDWQPIASYDFSPSGFLEWVDICLWATGASTTQYVEIAFSNFQVTYDQVKYVSSVPALLDLLLLN